MGGTVGHVRRGRQTGCEEPAAPPPLLDFADRFGVLTHRLDPDRAEAARKGARGTGLMVRAEAPEKVRGVPRDHGERCASAV